MLNAGTEIFCKGKIYEFQIMVNSIISGQLRFVIKDKEIKDSKDIIC